MFNKPKNLDTKKNKNILIGSVFAALATALNFSSVEAQVITLEGSASFFTPAGFSSTASVKTQAPLNADFEGATTSVNYGLVNNVPVIQSVNVVPIKTSTTNRLDSNNKQPTLGVTEKSTTSTLGVTEKSTTLTPVTGFTEAETQVLTEGGVFGAN